MTLTVPDLGLPQQLWLPPKPAIIRPAELWRPLGPEFDTGLGIDLARDLGINFNLKPDRIERKRSAFPFPIPSPVVTAGGPTFYSTTNLDSSTSTTFTFTSVAIGTANANRRVYVPFRIHNNTATVSSVTIGGITATAAVTLSTSAGLCAIYFADVPTGTTANIVITATGSVIACVASTYITTFASPVLQAINSAFVVGGTTATWSNVSIANGGVGLFFSQVQSAYSTTASYTGSDSIVLDNMTTVPSSRNVYSRSIQFTEDSDARNFTTTLSASDFLWVVGATFFSSPYDSFNVLDTDVGITISVKCLKATRNSNNSGFWRSVRGRKSHTTGKYYMEATVNAIASGVVIGVCISSMSLANFCGASSDGMGVYSGNGSVYKNSSPTGAIASFGASDNISIAVDLGAQIYWCRKNGGAWNGDPVAGTGGVTFPSSMTAGSAIFAGASGNTNGDALTENFGATSFTYSIPSGYSAWG